MKSGDRTQHELSVQNNRDAQRILLSDSCGEEGSDGSISLGTSESGSFQDSDSSWDLKKRQVSLRSKWNANRRRGDDRTEHEVIVQSNRDANKGEVMTGPNMKLQFKAIEMLIKGEVMTGLNMRLLFRVIGMLRKEEVITGLNMRLLFRRS